MKTPTQPAKTFYNDHDGHTYWIEPAAHAGSNAGFELWACPTLVDGTPEFSNSIAANDFDEPLAAEERQHIVDALTHDIRRIVWKDEGRDSEGCSFGPAYAVDAKNNTVLSYGWITWKQADGIAKALQVELQVELQEV